MPRGKTEHTILLIDDSVDNRQLTVWALEDAGYNVDEADTAEAGLQLLEKKSYSLVLMDISLPGMDGKQATREIRGQDACKHLPVIALTAHTIESEIEEILASGVDGILNKPIEGEELLAIIDAQLKP